MPLDDNTSENVEKPVRRTEANPKFYPDFSRKLVCIEYPGLVENVDKAFDTLGGMTSIEKVVSNNLKKLELRFHSKNLYCKPCCADRNYKPGILLKVKIRQPKTTQAKPSVIDYDVVGVTAMNFKFNRLCDFQYLPLTPKPYQVEMNSTNLQYVYDQILPQKLPNIDWLLSKEAESMPFFLPPAMFSRFDVAQNKLHFEKSEAYRATTRPELGERIKALADERKKQKEKLNTKGIFPRKKTKKPVGSVSMNFDDAEVPKNPPDIMQNSFYLRNERNVPFDIVQKLFEERGIWSKAELVHKSGISNEHMKNILPMFAYYCISGPWRVMWIKYGYDPRKDPSSRKYQTFDFRVRTVGGSKLGVKPKRTYLSRKSDIETKKFTLKGIDMKKKLVHAVEERNYVLRPDVTPPARQLFYQYCNIKIPEIEAMLSKLPELPPDAKCDPKNGFLPARFHDQCREIASKHIAEQVKKELMESSRDTDYGNQGMDDNDPAEDDDDDDVEIIEDPQEEADDGLKDSDGSASESEGEANNDIDMEAVEEINRLLQKTSNQANSSVKGEKE